MSTICFSSDILPILQALQPSCHSFAAPQASPASLKPPRQARKRDEFELGSRLREHFIPCCINADVSYIIECYIIVSIAPCIRKESALKERRAHYRESVCAYESRAHYAPWHARLSWHSTQNTCWIPGISLGLHRRTRPAERT
jgi:hypothetical protein